METLKDRVVFLNGEHVVADVFGYCKRGLGMGGWVRLGPAGETGTSSFAGVVERDKGSLGAQARLALGELAEQSGDLDGALSEYLKVGVLYAHAPSVAEALFRSGRCLQAQGQADAARARYREVIEQHPDQPAAARAREQLRSL